jgi:2-polyprenyl-3-methyl-5-hydroxy-6-metoxy-1,4-benzoquinol methylase
MDKVGVETLKRMEKISFYNEWLVGNVKKYLGGEILEIGCGIGNMTEILIKYGNVTATDYDKYYIANAKKRLKNKVKVGFGDAETGKFFFKNRKFDVVINFNVLEHIKNDEAAIENMGNVLKKGGKLAIVTPAHKILFGTLDKNLDHYRRYSKDDISEKFVKAGFAVAEVKYLNWFGALGWFVNSRILHRRILPSKQLGIFGKIARPFLFLEKYVSPPFGLSVLIVGVKK